MNIRRWILNKSKKKSRVYIMPTKMGGYLNGLIFLMFLLSVGYSNNLLLIFTLFLFGLDLIWLIQTHLHMESLRSCQLQIEDGHAGEPLLVSLNWNNPDVNEIEVSLINKDEMIPVKLINATHGEITLNNRGQQEFQHIRLKTDKPFGLYQSWMYLPVRLSVLVYPARLQNVPFMISESSSLEGDSSTGRRGNQDIHQLSSYQGDESRKLSWKHYARTGELLIKEGEELIASEIHFHVGEDGDKEFHLSRVATQMIYCERNHLAFSLETGQRRVDCGLGSYHLKECLSELARC